MKLRKDLEEEIRQLHPAMGEEKLQLLIEHLIKEGCLEVMIDPINGNEFIQTTEKGFKLLGQVENLIELEEKNKKVP